MKIAVNTRWLLPNRLEGYGWYTHSLLQRIVREHPEVAFHFIFDRKPDAQFKYAENVHFHTVYPQARHPKLWRIWNHFSVPLKLKRIKPDVYFSPDGFAALGYKGRQLLTIHDLNFEHHPEWIPYNAAHFLQKYTVQYAHAAHRIVCVSQTTLDDVNRTYQIPRERMDIVYNAPQQAFVPDPGDRPALPFGEKTPYFVVLGAINPRKNLPLAVRAFNLYRLSGGMGHLVVIGERMHHDDDLKRMLDETPYAESIHFVGRMNSEDLNKAISNSRALLFTSLFEGFGIPIAEGMAAGTAVICTNISCMPEIAGNGALLLSPFDAQSWADAMHDMEKDETRNVWIEKGLERVKFFSWDKSAGVLWENLIKTAGA